MAKNNVYLAVGEEAIRGTGESTTVGFIPLAAAPNIAFEPDDRPRKEFRGEDSQLGDRQIRRYQRAWSTALELAAYTEAGTVAGMVGTMLKHFFGKATSVQNALTGQYAHMMYPVVDPFDAANLGTKALTLNENLNEESLMKNHPWIGGRVKSLAFNQEPGQQLKITEELFGQLRGTVTAELGSVVNPLEGLRLDYDGCRLYAGTITRVGTPPDYTDFTFGSADQIKPDKIDIKIENGMEDMLRMAGVNYADKTRLQAIFKVTLEFLVDWEDPASGFSSVDEYNNWIDNNLETNFCCHWDSGTQAGTGDNHALYIDMPRMVRKGGQVDRDLEKDPMIPLTYEGLYDATTTLYQLGLLLKNTATAV